MSAINHPHVIRLYGKHVSVTNSVFQRNVGKLTDVWIGYYSTPDSGLHIVTDLHKTSLKEEMDSRALEGRAFQREQVLTMCMQVRNKA